MENSARPHWLPYRAKDGVVEIFLGLNGSEDSLISFFDRAITWARASEKGAFRLLDSFLSDSLTVDLLAKIFQSSSSAHPTEILIVDPESDFALARAKSIGQVAAKEVRSGVLNILYAIQATCGIEFANLETSSFEELLKILQDNARRVSLEVRFYSEMPSGPHYFFKDILLSGRFCAGLSSSKLPWTMIIDDPGYKGDLYDVYSDEFNRIWEKATVGPERRVRVANGFPADMPAFDLAVIAANEVEWNALFDLPRVQWQQLDLISIGSSIFYGAKFEKSGREISVVATRQASPGMVCGSIATTHLLQLARVSFLAVVGVCAGAPTKVPLGSIVIADQIFDAQAGKFSEGILQSNIDSISLDRYLFQKLRDRSSHCMAEARKACESLRPPGRGTLRVVDGKVATVGQVVADAVLSKQIWGQYRQCVALDMESYGVFRAAEEFSSERRPRLFFIKAAVDFADERKNDRYQKFGAALSANFLWNFCLENLAK
jgi:nucleoside phosphorylase